MRRLILLLLAACGGCRTAEVAINYPITGLQIAAKFEAREKPIDTRLALQNVDAAELR
jgi:hypothetical protein